MKKPLVSVIVTTKNEEKNIGRFLLSIANNSYPNTETIVVDNNSQDKTQEIVRSFIIKQKSSHILLLSKGPERSAQRNFGAENAKGEYVVFLDADMELPRSIIAQCVDAAEGNKNVGGIIIPEISIGKNFWEKAKAFERSFYFDDKDASVEAARFFPLSVFSKVGGYDESITGPEDWDLPETIKKKGWEIYRISEALYHHESITSLFSLAKKKYYYGLRAHVYLKKQKTNAVSSKTLYFLRPVFYKYPKKYLSHPVLALGMVIMLTAELFAGGLGFFTGKFKKL